MKKIRLNVIISIMIFLNFIFVGCSKKVETPVSRIGIIGAMDEEVKLLKNYANITNIKKIAEMEFCEAILNDKKVVIVQSGIGKVNAGICANTLINNFPTPLPLSDIKSGLTKYLKNENVNLNAIKIPRIIYILT